ncbi:MAG: FAD-binding oxidoreductase [Ectothiorhodospiraceae bacterium]|nr:FAD-binding oxidoreductase [Ectothiorhodospiraceae bacterium]MCH8505462.1 FAD-binding oxidoreductase [Ectothiorhodospiraceae bacterium]
MTDEKGIKRIQDDLAGLDFITDPGQLERFSRDFAWFSPVLVKALADKRAQAVVRPRDEEEVKRVISSCVRHQVPLTLRGSGTGNYGQSTPLHGGVVMDMGRLDAVRWIEGAVARVQAGARLVNIDKEAKPKGWELRLLPSTYRLATAGGFYCGGFGGVGSITYGSIGDPGNVLGVRALSMEAEPRVVELRGGEARDLYHAYGVNGVITELEFALAPAYDWHEALLSFPDFMTAVRFAQTLGKASGIIKKLLTVLADPLPQMCGLDKSVPPGQTAVIAIVTATGAEALRELCGAHDGTVVLEQDHAQVYGTPKTLIEHTWNHTTLHILKKDKGITYLQSGFRPWENVEKVEEMYRHFGNEVMMHLEFLRADGALTCSGLQVIRYSTEERLNEIIQYHRDNGVHVANPHTYLLEDGNKGESDPRQVAMKRWLDPQGLLNPGKMQAWDDEAAA